jgi:hypothetical protein
MNTTTKTSRGMGLVKVLVLIPLALIAILVVTFGFYEARKAYWDYQVDKLCAIDGGIKINEVMYLDAPEYAQLKSHRLEGNEWIEIPYVHISEQVDGSIYISPGEDEAKRAVAYQRHKKTHIRIAHPHVFKEESSIIRSKDGVVLASDTQYGRSGGDISELPFLFAFFGTGHGCARKNLPSLQTNLTNSVIKPQGGSK